MSTRGCKTTGGEGILIILLRIYNLLCSLVFRTREVIKALLEGHVAVLNQVFEPTDFNGIRGINFVIRRISVD